MKLVFAIFKYFPFGGLQGDFLRIATECRKRGHEIIVYTQSWDGPVPEGFDIRLITPKALTNHGKAVSYYKQLQHELKKLDFSGLIGFNRIPGLDVYFAGDNCLVEKATDRFFYRILNPRYRIYSALEQSIFSPSADTEIMYIARQQKIDYIKHYATQEYRFHLLPPGIPEDRRRTTDSAATRASIRESNNVGTDEIVLIQVGSGFTTKGVDRSIRALASLPDNVRQKTRLWIIGKNNPGKFLILAKTLMIASKVEFMGGRDDIPALMAGADLMIHPAVNEAAGNVLLEAMTAGLPVLCTAACGYAHYIKDSGAGRVIPEPFLQPNLNQALSEMLASNLPEIGERGIAFAQVNDFYSRHIIAADIIERVIDGKIDSK
jgi:UDP-glucose:(heptosyl)LPS alpha-1,3-glucosyltransferase